MHKWLTVVEKERLTELVAAHTPLSEIWEVIGRDRCTTRRNIKHLARRPPPEPKRSPLQLSLAEREEIAKRFEFHRRPSSAGSLSGAPRAVGPVPDIRTHGGTVSPPPAMRAG